MYRWVRHTGTTCVYDTLLYRWPCRPVWVSVEGWVGAEAAGVFQSAAVEWPCRLGQCTDGHVGWVGVQLAM